LGSIAEEEEEEEEEEEGDCGILEPSAHARSMTL